MPISVSRLRSLTKYVAGEPVEGNLNALCHQVGRRDLGTQTFRECLDRTDFFDEPRHGVRSRFQEPKQQVGITNGRSAVLRHRRPGKEQRSFRLLCKSFQHVALIHGVGHMANRAV